MVSFWAKMSIDWLLNDVFTNLHRGYLLEQKTRQQLVNYFNTVIEDFRNKAENSDGKDECKQVSGFLSIVRCEKI